MISDKLVGINKESRYINFSQRRAYENTDSKNNIGGCDLKTIDCGKSRQREKKRLIKEKEREDGRKKGQTAEKERQDDGKKDRRTENIRRPSRECES